MALVKVLAIASGGGHWVQLLRLRPAWEGCDVSYATVHADCASEVPGHRFFSFRDVSRKNLGDLPKMLLEVWRIVRAVRPDVVVTTGAAPPLFALGFARVLGARTLWIDSIANSEQLSDSGRLARFVAGARVTQWPALATDDVKHWGRVL